MITLEINIPPDHDFAVTEALIERCCASENLRMTLKGTLVQYPGCVHWHFKKGKQRGTLEITLWWETKRVWFKVSAGRAGDWIEPTMKSLHERIELAVKENQ